MLKNVLAIFAVVLVAVSCNKAPVGYAPYSVSNVPWGGQEPFSATTNNKQVFKPNTSSYSKVTSPGYVETLTFTKNMDSNVIDKTYIKRSYFFTFTSEPGLGAQLKANKTNSNPKVVYTEERMNWDAPVDTTKIWTKTYASNTSDLGDLHITVVKNDTVFRAYFEGQLGRVPNSTSVAEVVNQAKESVQLENGYINLRK
jgi:hypothetical protein